jgi:hypothetical protein
MRRSHVRPVLWTLVLGHFAVTLIHGAAHAAAAVPMTLAAKVFILLVIELGPIVGLMMSRGRPVSGAWIIAATMSGALVFGVVNHFVIAGADHVSHIADQWRGLFATTAVLLAITETAGIGADICYALTPQSAGR